MSVMSGSPYSMSPGWSTGRLSERARARSITSRVMPRATNVALILRSALSRASRRMAARAAHGSRRRFAPLHHEAVFACPLPKQRRREKGASRRDREHSLHVGMKPAVILDRAGLLQHERHGLLRRHRHIKVAVSRGRGMRKNVL